ncbi:MAG: hypothetical protein K9J06_05100 [Flavobacteriales bacterium]|nr:hypothetical protein [Flavobacteriales bacterium]
MKDSDRPAVLFIGLSWEERCFLGLKVDHKYYNRTTKVVLLYNEHSSDRDAANRDKIIQYCKKRNIIVQEILLKYNDSIFNWKTIEKAIFGIREELGRAVLDITTLPRELAWTLLYNIGKYTPSVQYIYHSPAKYTDEWVCKEPGAPRLLFRHSGISELNKPTALIILTGFDEIRTKKLVEYYEPKFLALGIQTGSKYSNNVRNSLSKHLDVVKGEVEHTHFSIDAYSKEHGLGQLNRIIKQLRGYNIVACSHGPKLTLVSLYRSHQSNPQMALCYVPSRLYNINYSDGIGETFRGVIEF